MDKVRKFADTRKCTLYSGAPYTCEITVIPFVCKEICPEVASAGPCKEEESSPCVTGPGRAPQCPGTSQQCPACPSQKLEDPQLVKYKNPISELLLTVTVGLPTEQKMCHKLSECLNSHRIYQLPVALVEDKLFRNFGRTLYYYNSILKVLGP
ncbi:hypothetical protein TURU_155892 [Turdus rufiventris]|nr:hypothetical protein TURU_155892 [Turdus rufiventris]